MGCRGCPPPGTGVGFPVSHPAVPGSRLSRRANSPVSAPFAEFRATVRRLATGAGGYWCHGCGSVAGGVQLRPVSGHRDVRCWRVAVLLGAASGAVRWSLWAVGWWWGGQCEPAPGGACWGRMF